MGILLATPAFASSLDTIKRDLAVNKSLDDWENVLRRHEQMGREISWTKANQKHYEMVKENKPSKSDTFDNAHARENVSREARASSGRKHQFNVGTEYFYAKYKEPDVMEQRGKLWGMNGAYAYRPNSGDLFYNSLVNTFGLESLYASGDFKYEAEAASQAGLQIDKDNYMYELRGILGREYIYDNDVMMLYSGFGYRYLNDDEDDKVFLLRGSTILGYERESNYYYIPAGFSFLRKWADNTAVKVMAEYDFFFHGKQISRFSDFNQYVSPAQASPDVENTQDSGYGIRGSVNLAMALGPVDLFAEPFFRYWHINDSEVVTEQVLGSSGDWIEPKNETIEAGMKLGFKF